MSHLKGKTAVITGSTSGIGLGIAKAFASNGANLVLNGFGDANDIEAMRQTLAKDHGVEVLYDGANLLDVAALEAMMARAKANFGSVDILVNNAGMQHVSPVEDFPVDKWNAIIGLNLSAAFHTTRLCFSDMKSKGWGRVINIASAHALVASPFKSAYVAAKHGLLGFTKTIALEGAQFGVTCNAICPGYVKTPLVEKQIPDTMKARNMSEAEVIRDVLLAAQPTKQFVSIEQVAAMALFLATDAGASINGVPISIDGGWTAQ